MVRRSKMTTCGNGIIEIGEDCDCGRNKSCITVEACCNPQTCQYYPGAECLSGPCCSGCKLIPSGYTCRASRNSCDVTEYCDGLSAQCPDDDNLIDGSLCNDNGGTCFRGSCVGAQQQCVELWGPGSKVAHESCYTNFNPTGSMTGHCGYDSRLNKYIPCFDNDVKCGLLHCEGGMPYPRIASSNFMIFNVNTRDGSFECKSISSPLQSVLVNDGSPCGKSGFCQNNTCIQETINDQCDSKTTCSANGICTTMGSCYCNPSWKGQDCSIYDINAQNRNSLNQSLSFRSDHVSPTTLVSMMSITFLLVLLCIIISCLFRNKTRRNHRKTREFKFVQSKQFTQPQVTINPIEIETNRVKSMPPFDDNNNNNNNNKSQSLVSTPVFPHQQTLQRTPFMMSNRSITSACTGHSYLPNDTPRSIRYVNRKQSSNGIFSDSETPRATRTRRPIRYLGSPYLSTNSNRHQTYSTLTLKRQHDKIVSYETPRKIYDDIDKISKNENLRDFMQVLDSFSKETFGGKDINIIKYEKYSPSSPTETNESITLDSGYQSTKQLISTDEYAVVNKPKRQRSYSSIDNKEQFCT